MGMVQHQVVKAGWEGRTGGSQATPVSCLDPKHDEAIGWLQGHPHTCFCTAVNTMGTSSASAMCLTQHWHTTSDYITQRVGLRLFPQHDGMRGGPPHMRGPPPVRAPAGSLGGDPRPNMTPIPVRFMGEEATYDPSTESITWQGEEFSCNAWCKRVAGKGGQNWKRSIRVNLDNGAKRPKLYDYLHQAGMGIE